MTKKKPVKKPLTHAERIQWLEVFVTDLARDDRSLANSVAFIEKRLAALEQQSLWSKIKAALGMKA